MGITIVLYKPEHPGNIGSIARACANFGFSDVVVVDSQCEITEESRNLAKNAQDTLENMMIVQEMPSFDTLVMAQGVACDELNMKRSGITPNQLRERLSNIDLDQTSVGIIFGPEGDGLPPEMLHLADIVLTIPTKAEYPSMNLAMAVTVVLYELSSILGENILDVFKPMREDQRKAALELVEKCLDQWEFPSDSAKETHLLAWRHMLGKSFLTEREAMTIMGFLKRCHGKR